MVEVRRISRALMHTEMHIATLETAPRLGFGPYPHAEQTRVKVAYLGVLIHIKRNVGEADSL